MNQRGSGMRRSLTILTIAACAFAAVAIWLAGSIMVRGATTVVQPAIPPARDITLWSNGGVRLAATYWPGAHPNAPGVLILHGVGASRQAEVPTARWLASLGYAVLTVDFRGHGGSTMSPRSFGWFEANDAHAGFSWIKRRQGNARVAVIGVSMGGAAALLGPAGPVPADALVLQAVYPDIRHAIRNRARAVLGRAGDLLEPLLSLQSLPRFGIGPSRLSPLHALSGLNVPVLVVGGAEDRYTPPAETRALFAAAPAGKRMLWLAPGADHGATSVLATQGYRGVLAGFLNRTIGQGLRRSTM